VAQPLQGPLVGWCQ